MLKNITQKSFIAEASSMILNKQGGGPGSWFYLFIWWSNFLSPNLWGEGGFFFWETKFTSKNKFPSLFQKFSQSSENSHHQNWWGKFLFLARIRVALLIYELQMLYGYLYHFGNKLSNI
jgi:hypothetical protein